MRFQLGAYQKLQPKADNPSGFVAICDSTLRDGEQAGVKYSLEQKLRLIQMMDKARIPEIQIYSLRNERSIAEAQAICAQPRSFSKIEVMSRATNPNWRKELEGIARIGADVTHTMLPLSEHVRGAYGPALEDGALMQRMADAVAYARSLGCRDFNVSFLDVTRTPEPLLQRAVKTAADAGANRICLADTVGCFSPQMTEALVRKVRKWAPRPLRLRVHLHNDFGLACANVLAAVQAGADMVDTCLNGMGKRAGNADTVQVVMGLKAFYGIETGVDPSGLFDLCKEIERVSGVPIPRSAPFTGELVFADDSEYHIKGNERDPFAFQAIDPQDWGNPRRVLIGRNSGVYGMKVKLRQLGYPAQSEDGIREIYKACIEKTDSLKAGEYLSDEMIMDICKTI